MCELSCRFVCANINSGCGGSRLGDDDDDDDRGGGRSGNGGEVGINARPSTLILGSHAANCVYWGLEKRYTAEPNKRVSEQIELNE